MRKIKIVGTMTADTSVELEVEDDADIDEVLEGDIDIKVPDLCPHCSPELALSNIHKLEVFAVKENGSLGEALGSVDGVDIS